MKTIIGVWIVGFLLVLQTVNIVSACCEQESQAASTLNGDWQLTTVVDNSAFQETVMMSVREPLLLVRSDKGYCALGIVGKKQDGYVLLWRYHTLRTTGVYKGSTRRDVCSQGGEDTEIVIAGSVSLTSETTRPIIGRFTAYKRTLLRVAVMPEGSGMVVSDTDAIACGDDCSEHYIGGCRRVTLTAVPASGWIFQYWQIGDMFVQDNPLQNLRISTDLNVCAVFSSTSD
ncbi:MAG: hypothetical protein N3B18_11045 [Desulfobacterota bacterium]|nr:hypothetical protein [Thermodesulfobacteriota bacterium]